MVKLNSVTIEDVGLGICARRVIWFADSTVVYDVAPVPDSVYKPWHDGNVCGLIVQYGVLKCSLKHLITDCTCRFDQCDDCVKQTVGRVAFSVFSLTYSTAHYIHP